MESKSVFFVAQLSGNYNKPLNQDPVLSQRSIMECQKGFEHCSPAKIASEKGTHHLLA